MLAGWNISQGECSDYPNDSQPKKTSANILLGELIFNECVFNEGKEGSAPPAPPSCAGSTREAFQVTKEKYMLILTRKVGESIVIDDDIKVTILGVKGMQVRIGIDAPKNVQVHREEIYKRIQAGSPAPEKGEGNQ